MNEVTESYIVLGYDYEKFLNQSNIGLSCLDDIHEAFVTGDMDQVKVVLDEFQQCVSQISQMVARKERREQLERVVAEFRSKGIAIDFVSRPKENAASAGTLTAF